MDEPSYPPPSAAGTSSPAPPLPPLPRLIPSLPDELSIICIALVPRSHHPFLTAVSRSWRATLRTPLLFSLRLSAGATQSFLLINLRTPTDQSRWYILDPIRSNHAPRLLPLPSPPLPSALGCAAASLGPILFLLGGSIHGIPSSAVQIFDARFNSWRLGPPMSAAREFAAAGAIYGRIYVVGGCLGVKETWAEELDPERETWRRVPSPPEIREKWMHGNAVVGGRLLAMADHGGVVFDPAAAKGELEQQKAWGVVPTALDLGWRGRAAAVGNILYSYDFLGKIKGYDMAKDEWKTVEGLEELPKFLHGATLANLGEVLCLVWEGKGRERNKEMEILCAGIKVSRTSAGGFKGSVGWSELIALAIPKGSSIAHCISLEF